jgi:protein TonB
MTSAQEKRNNNVALVLSVLFHGLLFLILTFTIAWRAPNPPLPEYGFELNFGTDAAGSGLVQPSEISGAEKTSESVQQEAQPEPEQPTQPEQTTPSVQQPQEEKPVDTKLESPVTVKEGEKQDVKKADKPAEKPVEKPAPKVETKPADTPAEKKDTPAEASKVNEGKPVSQGDKPKTTGDQGNPQGTPDAKALYGQQGGGGGGPQLELAGWTWDYIPKPNVPNNESGRIVFEIRVNADGELEGYRVVERSVGPEAERACREAIEKLTFSRKDGAVVPAISVGRITFIIRAQ